jgi:hypothetical protein
MPQTGVSSTQYPVLRVYPEYEQLFSNESSALPYFSGNLSAESSAPLNFC